MNKLKIWCHKLYEALKPPPSEFSLTQQFIITIGTTTTICILSLVNHLLDKENLLLLAEGFGDLDISIIEQRTNDPLVHH